MWINFTLALSPQKFPLQADTFGSAAGTAEKQKWALILPSSLSHSVTSSAGMTAYLVLLAHTRVGSSVEDVTAHHHKSRMPKKKRPLQGRRWLSLEHSRSAQSWDRWICEVW